MKKLSILLLSVSFLALGAYAEPQAKSAKTVKTEKKGKFVQCDDCKEAGRDIKLCEKRCGDGYKGRCAIVMNAKKQTPVKKAAVKKQVKRKVVKKK